MLDCARTHTGVLLTVFVLIIPRRPVSSNRGPNEKFREALAQAARDLQPAVFTGPLYARIIWFHKYVTSQDADNIAKRILDSFTGIVYGDDNAVTHCLTARVDVSADIVISDQHVSPGDYAVLLNLLGDEHQRDILYIEIGKRTATTVLFGEVM